MNYLVTLIIVVSITLTSAVSWRPRRLPLSQRLAQSRDLYYEPRLSSTYYPVSSTLGELSSQIYNTYPSQDLYAGTNYHLGDKIRAAIATNKFDKYLTYDNNLLKYGDLGVPTLPALPKLASLSPPQCTIPTYQTSTLPLNEPYTTQSFY